MSFVESYKQDGESGKDNGYACDPLQEDDAGFKAQYSLLHLMIPCDD
jgi:hypothetical protein